MSTDPQAEAAAILAAARAEGERRGLAYFGAIAPAAAQALLASMPSARLVDVRTSAEWDYVGHVPDSVLIEWNTYPDGTRNPAFLDELQRAVPDRNAPVLFLCRSAQRSDGAARLAATAGYTRALNILEGFEGNKDAEQHRGMLGGWRHAGLPWIQG